MSAPYLANPIATSPVDRRAVLDWVGQSSRTASDIFVVAVFLYFNLIKAGGTNTKAGEKRAGADDDDDDGARRTSWVHERTSTAAVTGQREPKGIVLLMLVWAALVSFFVFGKTGDDYFLFTKAPAQGATALLGANLVFSLPFLRQYSPQLISFHRLNAVLMLTLLAVHVLAYLSFYVKMGILTKRSQDLDVQLGFALSSTSLALWVTGSRMAALRRWLGSDQARWAHASLTSLYGVLLWFHVVHSHANVRRAGLVWAIGQLWRGYKAIIPKQQQDRKQMKQT